MIDLNIEDDDIFEGPNYNDESSEAEEMESDSESEDVDLHARNVDVKSDAFAPCMVPIPETQKNEKQKVIDALQWPSRESNPVDEFHTIHLAAKCFPTLFPNGTGDPTNPGRIRRVSFREGVRHLLKVAHQRDEGTWYHTCAAHPRFAIWALNMI